MMKLLKSLCLITFLLCCRIFAMAQGSPAAGSKLDNLRNVIPPSPEASTLGKYGEWPVSLYTGIPNISIPLYELKGRSLSIPVSLSYNSAGNKVGEIASSVGLGWSMQTGGGGIISRSVRSLPDEDLVNGWFIKQQLYSNPNDMCSMPLDAAAAAEHKVQAARGQADAEQDIYSFSGMGRSFKFYIKADGTIVPMPYSKVKLSTNFITTGGAQPEAVVWTATLEDGTRLEFGGAGFYEMNNNPRYDNGSSFFVTSWLLKKIISADNEEVTFTYTASSVDQDSYFSESDALKYNLGALQGSLTNCQQYITTWQGSRKRKAERQQVTMLQVATIETVLGRIEFEQSALQREDLKGAKAVTGVKVFSKTSNSYLLKYKFTQEYSQCTTSNEFLDGVLDADKPYYQKRLKLLSIEKYSGTDVFDSRWVFDYNPQALPSRRSYAQDHWGFYNGLVNNNTLLPKYFYTLPSSATQNYPNAGFNAPAYDAGVSREGNGMYAQAEILQSITYPTGGKTNFYFEANCIPITEPVYVPDTKNVSLSLRPNSNPFTTSYEQTFTVSNSQNVLLSFTSYISQDILDEQHSAKVTATVINTATQQTVTGITSTVLQFSDAKNFNIISPGTYILRIATNVEQASLTSNLSEITASAYLQYQLQQGTQTINKNTGGLRLQKMVTTDAVNAANNMEKSFVYENPLIISPVDIKALYFTETEELTCENTGATESGSSGGNGDPQNYLSCRNKVITRNSSTKYSLGNIQGGTVGYGKVTTLLGAGGANGKTVSEFTNEQDAGLDMTVIYPYAPTDSREHRRGLLLTQTDYTAAGAAVSKTENTYQFLPRGVINQFKVGYSTVYSANSACAGAYCNAANGDCGIQKLCYGTTMEQVKQLSSIQTTYTATGNMVSSTLNYYDNADNPQPTRVEIINSKGETIKQVSRTPLEKNDIQAASPMTVAELAAIDSLLAKNIIAPVLQTEEYKNNLLKNRSLITYKNWGGGMIKPAEVRLQQGTAPLKTKIYFNQYDITNGNLLEQQKDFDVKHIYLYDYDNSYPIAEAINVAAADIAATSFEADGKGNFSFAALPVANTNAPTGKKVYPLSNSNITKAIDAAKTYTVTLWASSGVSVNGTAAVKTGRTINGFTYYEYQISNATTATISGVGNIDELRLFPKNVLMTTYTYDPLIGMTTQCSAADNIQYYEYDSFGRLKYIRDMDGKVVKVMEYRYGAGVGN
jgi:YD repeat-containing protein